MSRAGQNLTLLGQSADKNCHYSAQTLDIHPGQNTKYLIFLTFIFFTLLARALL
jgi:hypothetical protein